MLDICEQKCEEVTETVFTAPESMEYCSDPPDISLWSMRMRPRQGYTEAARPKELPMH